MSTTAATARGDVYITAEEGARVLGATYRRFRALADEGRFATKRLPGQARTRYRLADVEALLDESIRPATAN